MCTTRTSQNIKVIHSRFCACVSMCVSTTPLHFSCNLDWLYWPISTLTLLNLLFCFIAIRCGVHIITEVWLYSFTNLYISVLPRVPSEDTFLNLYNIVLWDEISHLVLRHNAHANHWRKMSLVLPFRSPPYTESHLFGLL